MKVLQHKVGLENRGAAGVTLGIQLFHQQGKRVILMFKRPKELLPHLAEQLGKGRFCAEIHPGHHRRSKVANHAGKFGVMATGHREADQNVILPTVAVQ